MKRRLLIPSLNLIDIPAEVLGKTSWFDGADIKNDSSNYTGSVDSWVDKVSGTYSVSQAVVANRPTTSTVNGLTSVLFDGTNDQLSNSLITELASTASWTIIICAKPSNIGDLQILLNLGTGSANVFRIFADTREVASPNFIRPNIAGNGYGAEFLNFLTADTHIFTITFNAVTRTFTGYLDKIFQDQNSYPNGGYLNDNFIMGAVNNGSFYDGNICEIITYDRVLNALERDIEETYLINKWIT